MKILRVGDVHCKPNNREESYRLMEFVVSTAIHYNVDVVELEGDLFDTHDVVRLSVLKFWDIWFHKLSWQPFKVRVLVGNHDLSGEYSDTYSALHPFIELENDNFKIVHAPYLDGVFGYLPYIHDNGKFIEEANKLADLGATVLVSHPNYEGAVYDNGSPITGAVSPDSLDSRFFHLIGGHIHTELELGRIWYIGSPRWLTKSCANKQKGIWLCEHDETGLMTSKQFISTEGVCTPIVSLVWKEGEPKPETPKNATTNIELVGSSEWVIEQKKDLKGVSISSKITDIKKSKARKSGSSLHEFLAMHYKAHPKRKERLIQYLGDLGLV